MGNCFKKQLCKREDCEIQRYKNSKFCHLHKCKVPECVNERNATSNKCKSCTENRCNINGCFRESKKKYCELHKCLESNCNFKKLNGYRYCYNCKCQVSECDNDSIVLSNEGIRIRFLFCIYHKCEKLNCNTIKDPESELCYAHKQYKNYDEFEGVAEGFLQN